MPAECLRQPVDFDDSAATRPVRDPDLAVLIDCDRDAGGTLHHRRPRHRHAGSLDSITADHGDAGAKLVRRVRYEDRDEELAAHDGVEHDATLDGRYGSPRFLKGCTAVVSPSRSRGRVGLYGPEEVKHERAKC